MYKYTWNGSAPRKALIQKDRKGIKGSGIKSGEPAGESRGGTKPVVSDTMYEANRPKAAAGQNKVLLWGKDHFV
jgi:hypothetical protein